MKIKICDAEDRTIAEANFGAQALGTGGMQHIAAHVIGEALRKIREGWHIDQESDRIVENAGRGTLEALDEDGSILGSKLNLKEACLLSFDKHIDATLVAEGSAMEERKRHTELHPTHRAQQDDARKHRERPGDRTRIR